MALDLAQELSPQGETLVRPPAKGRDAAPPPGPDLGRHALWPVEVDQRCTVCGYGIAAGRIPDRCPMCGGLAWRVAGHPPHRSAS